MEWRDVIGYEGLYVVSSFGEVRSLPRRGTAGRVLAMHARDSGHLLVTLSARSKTQTIHVHKLVLEAFVEPQPDGLEGRHLNGIPDDNRLENLQWGTRSENQLDAVGHGTHVQASKTHCPQGHPYDEGNTYHQKGTGYRICRPCQIEHNRKYRARK